MPFFQLTFTYREADSGWNEIFYDEAPSIDSYGDIPFGWRQAMVNFRGLGVRLQSMTATEEGGLRRSKIIKADSQSTHMGLPGAKDSAGVKAKVRLNFSGGGGRVWNVGGVADTDVIADATGPSFASAALELGIAGAVAFLVSPEIAFLGKRLKSISTVPWKQAVTLSPDPTNGEWTRVTISDIQVPVPNGTEVYFRGFDKLTTPWLRGIFRTVGATSETFFSIPTLYRLQSPTTALRNVQWREAEYDYPAITDGGRPTIGTRDTAGPFGSRRGRRSSQPSR